MDKDYRDNMNKANENETVDVTDQFNRQNASENTASENFTDTSANENAYMNNGNNNAESYADNSAKTYGYNTGSNYTGFGNQQSAKEAKRAAKEAKKAARKEAKMAKKNVRKGGFGSSIPKVAVSAAVFGLVAGVAFQGAGSVYSSLKPTSTSKVAVASTTSSSSSDSSEGVSAVAEAVMPSVVSITCKIQEQSYFGTQEAEGAGSGFIIAKTDGKLYIATNAHVVEDATDLTVGFVDDTTAVAELVRMDSSADLAVISVNASDLSDDTASNIKIAVLNDSEDAVSVGESVVAIGNALGYGQSVTTGVISATNREVSFTDGTMTLLQTDAAINPGNSGGVLCNMKGEVIGINNSKLEDTSVEGMGYAIPMSTAKAELEDLMNSEDVSSSEASYLGIVGKDIDSSYSSALNIPEGIYVSEVESGSPAEEAGIEAGDVIVGFNDQSVTSMEGLKEKMALKKAGTKVTVTVKRANQNGEYEEKTLNVTLGKASNNTTSSNDSQNGSNSQDSQSGNGSQDSNGNGYYYFFGNQNGSNSQGGSSDGSSFFGNY